MNLRTDNRTSYQDAQTGEHPRLAHAAPASRDPRAPRRKALDVVRDICGLHAQLTASAELTLWARVDAT